jgi:hypothetical protein
VNQNALADRLLDEFVTAHTRGERPDVGAFLGRAGPARDRLGELIDRYLQLAPVQEPDDETVVALEARLQHVAPLTAARTRRKLKVDDVVERLRAALALPDSLRGKLRTAYRELEAGQLDPAGVDTRVWDALHVILGLDARRLLPERRSFATLPAFYRLTSDAPIASAPVTRTATGKEPDGVDLLFRATALS